jgi:hypothetical protein
LKSVEIDEEAGGFWILLASDADYGAMGAGAKQQKVSRDCQETAGE